MLSTGNNVVLTIVNNIVVDNNIVDRNIVQGIQYNINIHTNISHTSHDSKILLWHFSAINVETI